RLPSFFLQPLGFGFLREGGLDFFIPFDLFFLILRRADDVDLPTGQPRGQPDILSVLADGQRQLRIGGDDQRRLLFFIDTDVFDGGRVERFGDDPPRILGPGDDADFLAPQLADNRLDARSFDADTGTNRIHGFFPRHHRDLRAITRLTDDRFDLDDLF